MNKNVFRKLDAALVWLRDFVIVWFVIAITAYLAYHFWTTRDITWRWQEQVQLEDGSQILIRRVQETEVKGGGEPFTDPRGPKLSRIEIKENSKIVEWTSKLMPMILERGQKPGQWVIIASPIFCEDHYKFGSPKPPYIRFDYADGKWTYRLVDPVWYGRRSNLLMAYEKFKQYDGKSVSAEEIKKFNKPVYKVGPDYLMVDSKYISNCDR